MDDPMLEFAISIEGLDQSDTSAAAQETRDRILDFTPPGTVVELSRTDREAMSVGETLLIAIPHAIEATVVVLHVAEYWRNRGKVRLRSGQGRS